MTLPNSMKIAVKAFGDWYKNKNQNRNLTWSLENGQLEIKTSYAAKPYTLVTDCFQAIILMLFNDKDSCTMEEILTVTQMPRDNFVAAMKMLCNPKIGVLKKNPNIPTFEKNHTMALNMAFKSN